MIIAISTLSIVLFVVMLKKSGVIQKGRDILSALKDVLGVFGDEDLDDLMREKEIQKASLRMFGYFFSILLRSLFVLALAFVPIGLAGLLFSAPIDAYLDFLAQWQVILVSAVLITVWFYITEKQKKTGDDQTNNYSVSDQLLHTMAFSAIGLQKSATRLESLMYGRRFQNIEIKSPIFITSLPRAGTTLMLEVLSRFPSLASHTYRDMPFLLTPYLWAKMSRVFQKKSELRERAHGDGMQVGFDSPEAFEEILWRSFWPEKYSSSGIELWTADDEKDAADSFFTQHMKKIIALRCPDHRDTARYVSKNNANISRLQLIAQMFPDAVILLILRHPLEQATSLLRQHRHFLELHEKDPFVRQYMRDIGHYEFGDLHRPIRFPAFAEYCGRRNPLTLNYWLGYWISAFEFVSQFMDNLYIIPYEQTCRQGAAALERICTTLDIPTEGQLDAIAGLFGEPSMRGERGGCDKHVLEKAERVYNTLLQAKSIL
ncbi:MAG: sulfotransferase [candidate division KSB1 bacterium]|nr:sulfotransferase [candidate division KSB1 bacterium]